MRKSMKDFIRENRDDLNACSNSVIYRWDGRGGRGTGPTPPPKHSEQEIREWIANDEGLYHWAKAAGVRV